MNPNLVAAEGRAKRLRDSARDPILLFKGSSENYLLRPEKDGRARIMKRPFFIAGQFRRAPLSSRAEVAGFSRLTVSARDSRTNRIPLDLRPSYVKLARASFYLPSFDIQGDWS